MKLRSSNQFTASLEKIEQAEQLMREATSLAQGNYNMWQVVFSARRKVSYARDYLQGQLRESNYSVNEDVGRMSEVS